MIMSNLFQRKCLVILMKLKKDSSTESEQVSNGLENFGVEGETAPDLFSSDNETTETERLLPTETNENISEDDDLEIPSIFKKAKKLMVFKKINDSHHNTRCEKSLPGIAN